MPNGQLTETQQMIMDVAQGNPGALRVCMDAAKRLKDKASPFLQTLKDKQIVGSLIWMGYKDFSGQDLNLFIERVQDDPNGLVAQIEQCKKDHPGWF